MFSISQNSKKGKKKLKNFARFWENETQKLKIYEKTFLNSPAFSLSDQQKNDQPQRTAKGQ